MTRRWLDSLNHEKSLYRGIVGRSGNIVSHVPAARLIHVVRNENGRIESRRSSHRNQSESILNIVVAGPIVVQRETSQTYPNECMMGIQERIYMSKKITKL